MDGALPHCRTQPVRDDVQLPGRRQGRFLAMQIAFVIYPGFTILDVIGPFQTLADKPEHDVLFVAPEAGPVWEHSGQAQLVAAKSIDDVTSPDIVVVSGGDTNDPDRRIVE